MCECGWREGQVKVVVCGDRGFQSPAQVWREMDKQHAELHFTDLMQGGCPTGVDKFARDWAKTKPEIKRWVCRAEWTKYGLAAGPIRNGRMAEWKPDYVIAFPGGRGTADMMRQAEAAGIQVRRVLQ
jgi:hypothetical protein